MPWRRNQEPKRLLTYIDLVQDIDVLLPIVLAVRERTDWPQEIRVARWLASASPRSAQLLRAHRLPFRWTLRRGVIAGRTPSLSGVGAVLTAAESTSDTHTAGHALANRARASGTAAFTVQHGLENVALRADEEGRWETLASDHIFVWSDGVIDGRVPADTLRKRLAVGRARMARQPATPTFDVAVFENLHAPRYDAADHARFLSGIDTLLAMSGLKVLLRAHPAGGWLDAHAADLRRHPHVTLIDSRTAPQSNSFGSRCRGVGGPRDHVAIHDRLGCSPSRPDRRPVESGVRSLRSLAGPGGRGGLGGLRPSRAGP